MATRTTQSTRGTTGLVLGKFLPPHLGHQFLIDFARHYVDELVVLVCTLGREPIPGELRYGWMREMFPHANVRLVHVTEDLPQEPAEHPEFWGVWRDVVRRHLPVVDYVFASEDYGHTLAEVLSATYVPVDQARDVVPVSGTLIRAEPMKYWRYLPAAVRPHYVRRVCLFGSESTGKTTLARRLAERFETVWVHEHARPLLDHKAGVCAESDIPLIARGQVAAEEAMARQANRVLFCDTDPLLTVVWSEVLFEGRCPEGVRQVAEGRRYDLYLLTDVDVPWVSDGQRYLPHLRSEFFERCEGILRRTKRAYVVVGGDWEERFRRACGVVEDLLARP